MMRRAYFREEDLLSFTWKLGKITGEWERWHVVKGGCIWVLRVRIKWRDNVGDAIKGRLMNLVANLEMDMMKSGDNVGFRPGQQKQWMTPATEMGKGRGDFKFFQKVIVWLGASWPWGCPGRRAEQTAGNTAWNSCQRSGWRRICSRLNGGWVSEGSIWREKLRGPRTEPGQPPPAGDGQGL